MDESPRILVVKLSAIGDCLHATPVAQALREGHPNSFLGWAVHLHCAPVITGNPHLNKIHRWDRRRSWTALIQFARLLRREHYDIALDLQGLFKSGLVTRLSGAKRRYGPTDAREKATLFYTNRIPPPVDPHIIDIYLRRAESVGARWDTPPPMHIPFSNREREYAAMLLSEAGHHPDQPVVFLNPSAGKTFKQWPPERFARVGEALVAETGALCIVTGSPGDRHLESLLMGALHTPKGIVSMVGRTTLLQLAALFEQGNLFIGGDTGPMHISTAVETPVLALFGPTNPVRLGPRGQRDQVIYYPSERDERGMHSITVDEVIDKAKGMLAEPRVAYSK
ncbi:MAG: glycosyltransferase family 9 protein [Armatimonadetes bacterium]|nr:glycosyltransferase family 9 protein [Armatimonadota bacterium]